MQNHTTSNFTINNHTKVMKLTFMAMMVALGVIISPILRVEGMCPMAHLINVTCAVFTGPYYGFLTALIISILRMSFLGIPPLAITGQVFGVFLAGMLYRLSHGKLIWAFLGEVIGTGIIGAIISYPVMTYIWGRTGLTWFFYVPSFIAGTLIGGSLGFILLSKMQKAGLVAKFQAALGSTVYNGIDSYANDAIGIAVFGFIGYLLVLVIIHNFIPNPTPAMNAMKYVVLFGCFLGGAVYYLKHKTTGRKSITA